MTGRFKLSARKVESIKPPTKGQKLYGDGGNLSLVVKDTGSKSWSFRYMRQGKTTQMGLGPYPIVGLAEARLLAAEQHRRLYDGLDPLAEKRKATSAKTVTFDQCAEKCIIAMMPTWKNPKSPQQWRNTLKTYASPIIGTLSVAQIEIEHIIKILEPIWHTKYETAIKVRGRIEAVIDWAIAHQHLNCNNPAMLTGRLKTLLPRINRKAKTEHQPALPFGQMAEFMTELRKREGIAARAVEFGILTAARSGEIRGMTWDEFDEPRRLWIVPGERMKGDRANREHRVILSDAAIHVLVEMKAIQHSSFVFPGKKKGTELSENTPVKVLELMNADREKAGLPKWRDAKTGRDIVMHGFRSSFRDWVGEATFHDGNMAELALSHTVSNEVEASYRRGDMLEKRRSLMQDWADQCAGKYVSPVGGGGGVVLAVAATDNETLLADA